MLSQNLKLSHRALTITLEVRAPLKQLDPLQFSTFHTYEKNKALHQIAVSRNVFTHQNKIENTSKLRSSRKNYVNSAEMFQTVPLLKSNRFQPFTEHCIWKLFRRTLSRDIHIRWLNIAAISWPIELFQFTFHKQLSKWFWHEIDIPKWDLHILQSDVIMIREGVLSPWS